MVTSPMKISANGKSVDDCITTYISLAEQVFKTDEVAHGVIPSGDDQSRFDYRLLETAIIEIVEKYSEGRDPNTSLVDLSEGKTPTFVVATPGYHADGPPALLRSYGCQGHNADRCMIWEAGRATSAAPTFFKPIRIRTPPPGRIFVDGGLLHNNPSELALQEVRRLWPSVTKCCLVSVGTGRQKSIKVVDAPAPTGLVSRALGYIPGARTVAGVGALKRIAEACVALTTSSEQVHQRVLRKSMDEGEKFKYFRFQVERGMDEIGLEEWEKMDEMGDHVSRYLHEGEGEKKRDECADTFTDGGSTQQPQVVVPRLRP
jgi:hypothetical protein